MSTPTVHWPETGRPPRWMATLLPCLAATEFLEHGSFLFAAGAVAQGLHASPGEWAGVLAAFSAGSMLMVALQQALAQHLGYRRLLLLALGLFQSGAIGSLLAGNVHVLMGARAVQGLGAGALFTSGRILLPLVFAAGDRPAALRRFISLLFALAAFGPLMAALALQGAGWPAVFAVPLPMALCCTVMVWYGLPAELGRGQPAAWRLHRGPLVLMVLTLALLQLGLSEARDPLHFAGLQLWGPLVLGLLLLAGWLWHQAGHKLPLLRWQGMRHPAYLAGLTLYGGYYLVTNANGVALPLYASQVLGWPLWQVGVLASGGAAGSWLAARAYLRWWARSSRRPTLMALAATLMAGACALLALPLAGAGSLCVAVLVKGLFTALFVLPLAGLTFRELGDEHFGAGYQIKNLLRHLTMSGGMALGALVLSTDATGVGAAQLASRCATLFAALSLASLLLAWLTPRLLVR